MRRSVLGLLALSAVTLSSGCMYYQAPVMPPSGLLFAAIEAPLDPTVDRTQVSTKSGSATSRGVLGLVGFGDASTHSAAQNGRLTEVNYLDYKFLNILFLYQEFTTVAHGE